MRESKRRFSSRAQKGTAVCQEFNVLALVKGRERYIYVYDDDSRDRLIDAFRDQAADPAMNLSWFDAAVLSDKARQQVEANARQREDLPRRSRL